MSEARVFHFGTVKRQIFSSEYMYRKFLPTNVRSKGL
jgi:hypothetical protein